MNMRKETTREHIGDIHATLSLLPSLTALSCERFAGILTFTSERVYLFQISETYLQPLARRDGTGK